MASATTFRPTAGYALSAPARARLEAELADLQAERARCASESGSMCGDVADIAEFAARDMTLEQLDGRISRIATLLAESSAATPRSAGAASATGGVDAVAPGARVTMRFTQDDPAEDFVLGDRAERARGLGVITLSSPLGRALVGAHVGDVIAYAAPGGILEATVLDVQAA